MNIIIVGCGKVGYSLAETLCSESHDVTVIDVNEEKTERLANQLDVNIVHGNGASYRVLQEAGIEGCDILIAATSKDEVNMLCCLIARKAAQCRTIARVRDPNYYSEIGFIQEELGLSLAINPERSAASACYHLVQVPYAMDVDSFAKGRVEMVTFVLPENSPWANKKLMDISRSERLPYLVSVVERDHKVTIPNGMTELKAGDRVSLVVDIQYLDALFSRIGVAYKPIKNVMIAAGGNVGYYLARRLCDSKVKVKIIEPNRSRCEELVDLLPKATIIHGDPCNETVLLEEGLTDTDAFCALMGNDSENIMMALYATKYSKAKVITRINKLDLGGIVNEISIGSAVSPKALTAELILRYARATSAHSSTSRMEAAHQLANNQAEALAFLVTADSPATDRKLMNLNIKKGILVCAIIRDKQVTIPSGQDSIQKGDMVIVVTTHHDICDLRDILA